MYNNLIIFVCVLAVYGAYALAREIIMLFSRKNKLIIAIDVTENTDVAEDISLAEFYIQKHLVVCGRPVLICKTEETEKYAKYGYDIYVRSGEENNVCRE